MKKEKKEERMKEWQETLLDRGSESLEVVVGSVVQREGETGTVHF